MPPPNHRHVHSQIDVSVTGGSMYASAQYSTYLPQKAMHSSSFSASLVCSVRSRVSHVCQHCGGTFGSNNDLHRHLRLSRIGLLLRCRPAKTWSSPFSRSTPDRTEIGGWRSSGLGGKKTLNGESIDVLFYLLYYYLIGIVCFFSFMGSVLPFTAFSISIPITLYFQLPLQKVRGGEREYGSRRQPYSQEDVQGRGTRT